MTTPNKHTYFDGLKGIETADLFLTDKTDLINEEIHNNCISLALTNELAKEISPDDIGIFLSKVKSNRKAQLAKSTQPVDLIYYLWVDEMAGQLRFNFINSNHTKLPFECDVNFVDDEKKIIDNFIKSNHLTGIPFAEFTEIDQTNESSAFSEPNNIFVLNVYRQTISRSSDI